jgi:hypothetical protein
MLAACCTAGGGYAKRKAPEPAGGKAPEPAGGDGAKTAGDGGDGDNAQDPMVERTLREEKDAAAKLVAARGAAAAAAASGDNVSAEDTGRLQLAVNAVSDESPQTRGAQPQLQASPATAD